MPAARSQRTYPYAELRDDALANARRFIGLGLKPGDRLALIAETGAEFAAAFFGAVYAGVWPVPLPLPTSFGGREAYVDQLKVHARQQRPGAVPLPGRDRRFRRRRRRPARHRGARMGSARRPRAGRRPSFPRPRTDEIAYLQYSSGSTRFPHGVAVTHRALLDNLRAHGLGLEVEDTDRVISWLPWYHDMGLVGCLLSPIANQIVGRLSEDRGFRPPPARLARPHHPQPGHDAQLTRRPSATTFARAGCRSQTRAADRFDLSRWRIAGNGADMIRPDVMQAFVDSFAEAGFKASAFCPSYGLAEATLAVSLMPPGEGIRLELVEETELSGAGTPPTASGRAASARSSIAASR